MFYLFQVEDSILILWETSEDARILELRSFEGGLLGGGRVPSLGVPLDS